MLTRVQYTSLCWWQEELEQCRREVEAELHAALSEVNANIADLEGDDAIEAVVRPTLSGFQPGSKLLRWLCSVCVCVCVCVCV